MTAAHRPGLVACRTLPDEHFLMATKGHNNPQKPEQRQPFHCFTFCASSCFFVASPIPQLRLCRAVSLLSREELVPRATQGALNAEQRRQENVELARLEFRDGADVQIDRLGESEEVAMNRANITDTTARAKTPSRQEFLCGSATLRAENNCEPRTEHCEPFRCRFDLAAAGLLSTLRDLKSKKEIFS